MEETLKKHGYTLDSEVPFDNLTEAQKIIELVIKATDKLDYDTVKLEKFAFLGMKKYTIQVFLKKIQQKDVDNPWLMIWFQDMVNGERTGSSRIVSNGDEI